MRQVSEEKLASLEGETSAIRKEISDFNSRVKTAKRRVTDMEGKGSGASGSHLDLSDAPYKLHGVKYIDVVPLAPSLGRR